MRRNCLRISVEQIVIEKIFIMKKLLIAMMTFLPMWAEAFTGEAVVDGINYYIVTKAQTAEIRALPHSWDYSDSQRYTGDIVIPESIVYEGIECNVTSIGDNAFASCTGLVSIEIPNSVITIGNNAFAYCSGLTAVTIPNSVTGIRAFAFFNCTGLTSITIGSGVTSIGEGAFSWCSGLASVMIPNSVTFIGNQAFQHCSSLSSVIIGDGVTKIGMEAFLECKNLTNLTIGSGVTTIYSRAFANCSELRDVYCLALDVPATIYSDRYPSPSSDTFQDSYIEYATLHVPVSSIEAYRGTFPWKNFKNIVEFVDPSGIQGTILDKSASTPVYNLSGRRLNEPVKGINIVGVKKIIVK